MDLSGRRQRPRDLWLIVATVIGGVAIAIFAILSAAAYASSLLPREPTGERRQDVGDAIAAWARSAQPGDRLDLAEVAAFAWDRAAIFSAYAEPEIAPEVLGFAWNIDDAPTYWSDGGTLIGFADGDRVVAWTIVPNDAGFGFQYEGDGIAIGRQDAALVWNGSSFVLP